jgi:hypothetical protein
VAGEKLPGDGFSEGAVIRWSQAEATTETSRTPSAGTGAIDLMPTQSASSKPTLSSGDHVELILFWRKGIRGGDF